MRAARAWLITSMIGLTGCGYVGPVLPPSPELPVAVTDLTVVERGDQLLIHFTTPLRTTDNLPVKHFSEIDLRIGPSAIPFDFERWAASATPFELSPPPPIDPDDPQAAAMSKVIPAAEWISKHVAVAVRTAVKRTDHYSSWSNRVVLDVVPPLTPPVVEAKSTAKGVLLTWPAPANDLQYRIFRRSATDGASSQIGTSNQPEYLDTTAQYDTTYDYTVAAVKGLAESLLSKAVTVKPVDIYPPSVPASITALPAPTSIEVSWQRSPESDLKGYHVYRSVNGSPFERQSGLLTLPTFSDRNIEHGKTYRYEVSAVDQKNNESDKSPATQVNY